METSDLRQLEDSTLEHFRRDGIGEIGIAVSWVALAVLVNFEIRQEHILLGLFALLPVVYALRKLWNRTVIYPRLGYIQFREDVKQRWSSWRRQRMLRVTIGMIAVLIVLVLIRSVGGRHVGSPSPWNFHLFGLFMTSLLLTAMGVRKTDHCYAILTWTAILYFGSEVWGLNPMYAMIISAMVALVLGIRKLRRFLKENPVLEGEVNGNE